MHVQVEGIYSMDRMTQRESVCESVGDEGFICKWRRVAWDNGGYGVLSREAKASFSRDN